MVAEIQGKLLLCGSKMIAMGDSQCNLMYRHAILYITMQFGGQQCSALAEYALVCGEAVHVPSCGSDGFTRHRRVFIVLSFTVFPFYWAL